MPGARVKVVDNSVGHQIVGDRMKLTLQSEDSQALDVLMDRTSIGFGNVPGSMTFLAADGQLREHVSRMEKVLSVLENMPVWDPPADLLGRTLRTIEQSSGRNLSSGRNGQNSAFNQPPVA